MKEKGDPQIRDRPLLLQHGPEIGAAEYGLLLKVETCVLRSELRQCNQFALTKKRQRQKNLIMYNITLSGLLLLLLWSTKPKARERRKSVYNMWFGYSANTKKKRKTRIE